jgi:hypothetical protein
MCYQNCQYENFHGECLARKNLRPCDFESFKEYKKAVEEEKDLKAEYEHEQRKERRLYYAK